MLVISYKTEEEAEQIKKEKADLGLILAEVSNITEGNFLVFQEIGWLTPEQEKVIRDELNTIKERLVLSETAIDFLLMGGGV